MSRSFDDSREQFGRNPERADPRMEQASTEIRKCFNPSSGELTAKFQLELNGLKESIHAQERAERTKAPTYQSASGTHLPVGQKPTHSIILSDPKSVELEPEAFEKLPSYRQLRASLQEQGLTVAPRIGTVYQSSILGPGDDMGAKRMCLEVQRHGNAELREPPKRAPAPEVDTRGTIKQMREKMSAPKPGLMARLFGKK